MRVSDDVGARVLRVRSHVVHRCPFGVTRLSLGIENFNDNILRENGRAFPPNFLHEDWRDYLYWDSELESD